MKLLVIIIPSVLFVLHVSASGFWKSEKKQQKLKLLEAPKTGDVPRTSRRKIEENSGQNKGAESEKVPKLKGVKFLKSKVKKIMKSFRRVGKYGDHVSSVSTILSPMIFTGGASPSTQFLKKVPKQITQPSDFKQMQKKAERGQSSNVKQLKYKSERGQSSSSQP